MKTFIAFSVKPFSTIQPTKIAKKKMLKYIKDFYKQEFPEIQSNSEWNEAWSF